MRAILTLLARACWLMVGGLTVWALVGAWTDDQRVGLLGLILILVGVTALGETILEGTRGESRQ